MMYRTDLAVEAAQRFGENTQGIAVQREQYPRHAVTTVEILTPEASKTMHKPLGKYCTLHFPPFSDSIDSDGEGAELAAEKLREMLPETGSVLVMGLGNRELTADALGPKAAEKILATRHIRGEVARVSELDGLRAVSVCSPGVLGTTGIESAEILQALVREIQPDAVIAIDALAAMELERMGCTLQIADSGIAPGSGVGNHRPRLDQETLGVPVIAIGVPTVVDGVTFAAGLLRLEEEDCEQLRSLHTTPLTVTVREIDLMIARASSIIAMAVNRAVNPQVSRGEFAALLN